jgi:hypothetical protein
MRSFEVEHVHGLWHSDFHEGSRKVLLPSGEWKTPLAAAVDDALRPPSSDDMSDLPF